MVMMHLHAASELTRLIRDQFSNLLTGRMKEGGSLPAVPRPSALPSLARSCSVSQSVGAREERYWQTEMDAKAVDPRKQIWHSSQASEGEKNS